MKNLFQKKISQRITILIALFLFWFGVLVFRLVQLQVVQHAKLKAQIVRQNENKGKLHPRRGNIYDREGNILALSIPRPSVFFRPTDHKDSSAQYQKIVKLRRILNLSTSELRNIKSRIESDFPFIWLGRKIEPEIVDKIKKMEIPGVSFLEETKRYYPNRSLASHVLGRINLDSKGQSGVEYHYNDWLEGEVGEGLYLRDAKRRGYQFEILKLPIPGKDLNLSIDETIQYLASRELAKTVAEFHADWGTVIISQPSSGEILAMANSPEYDLNNPPSQIGLLERNQAIHYTLDPGSTFKIILASAAIESGRVKMTDQFDCSPGIRRLPGKTVTDHHPYEILTFPEVIIHSSNVGATFIGEQVGGKTYHDMIRAFGFGNRTGIDLPAEERGILGPMKNWSALSLASLSYGYEISVTPIQMLKAVNAIANRGISVPLRITREGHPLPISSLDNAPQERILSEYTAVTLTEILKKVIAEGTGTKANVPGFSAAGKTGTAQKFDRKTGRYTSGAHVSSFIGFVPADNPVISMIVIIDNPKGKYYGGDVAAPVFSRIAGLVLNYLGIPPEKEALNPLLIAHNRKGGTQ